MAKNKKHIQHFYSKEENEWIRRHPDFKGNELAKKFNKEFKADQTKIAIDKHRRRLLAASKTSKVAGRSTSVRLPKTPTAPKTPETARYRVINNGQKKQLLSNDGAIGSLMEKYIEKTGTKKDKFLVWAVNYIQDMPDKEFSGLYKEKKKVFKKK